MIAPFEQSPALAAIPTIRHGFFGRRGGISTGVYTGLNVSDSGGDDPEAAAANRAIVSASLGLGEPVILRQVHSNRVVTLDAPPTGPRVEADALVTNRPGIALGILTADCTPILFADSAAGIVGGAHAGWRGAVDGIVGNTIAAMVALGADPARIVAAIGPTISAPNYEVGPQFLADFLALHPNGGKHFFVPEGRREHFDLPGFIREQLATAGITRIEQVGACTYGAPERYFSHRYATHQGTTTGRQIAVIGLP
ncbi:hypothetical protein VW29_00285 [Devosia limi DSM 17137]|uniref:Purine nucleoside phosphorylase n=1 Tax=Devosia limi DSM 17137 TaxID=1121477 RepID=A0A0F5LWR3_9HYPH|nr:peptidoglycan editing factor PgeF [Devosia limi]KKB86736.1 hypothetical protein VW29_00285 [Devosia limi DSM 17137]SHF67003.1 conserved hypothetical protein [Devosia limi DSM 17137]